MENAGEPPSPDWVSKIVNDITANITATITEQIANLDSSLSKKIDDISKTNTELKTSVDLAHTKIGDLELAKTRLEHELDNSNSHIWALQRDNAIMEKRFDTLKGDQIRLETQVRKVNLTLAGIPETETKQEGSCRAIVMSTLKKYMGLEEKDVAINNCYRLGPPIKPTPGKKSFPRNIMVCCNTMRDRRLIWSSKRKLKDSKIYLGEDLPRETERRRAQLVPILKVARAIPKYKGIVFLNGDRLTVDKRTYTADTIHELPQDLNPILTATQRSEHTTLFYSRHSPFSNHFTKAPFTLGNTSYSCTEQFYFSQKADRMKDKAQYLAVMAEKDPALILKEGKKIKNMSGIVWEDEARNVMKTGNKAKYVQNTGVRASLLSTGNSIMGESSSTDDWWGTGFSLTHPDRNNTDLWGQNVMGLILMEVRNEVTPGTIPAAIATQDPGEAVNPVAMIP
jgi:hypothetical protein